jgi:hypothetical protein
MSTYSTRIGRLLGLDNDWSMVITVRLVYQINRSGPCSSNNGNDAQLVMEEAFLARRHGPKNCH